MSKWRPADVALVIELLRFITLNQRAGGVKEVLPFAERVHRKLALPFRHLKDHLVRHDASVAYE